MIHIQLRHPEMSAIKPCYSAFVHQEMFTTRHELALLRVSTLTGLVMFGGMSSLFYTQMTGILSVSTDHRQLIGTCALFTEG